MSVGGRRLHLVLEQPELLRLVDLVGEGEPAEVLQRLEVGGRRHRRIGGSKPA